MTAFKNIGEVMHLVTHTYTVQTFASAVSLLTNYHFRTIWSRQHTHTLCLLKNTDLHCSNLCKRGGSTNELSFQNQALGQVGGGGILGCPACTDTTQTDCDSLWDVDVSDFFWSLLSQMYVGYCIIAITFITFFLLIKNTSVA